VPTLDIPHWHREPFEMLAAASEAQFEAVATAVSPDRGTLDRPDLIASIEAAGFDPPMGRLLLDAFVGAISVRGEPGFGTVDDVARAIADSASLGLEDAQREELRSRLGRIFASESLEIISKGLDVISEYERVVHDTRIMTDLRPIYPLDAEVQRMSGALVIHTLRVDYHEKLERRDFFVAMTDSDLRSLARWIDRALQKGDNLRELLVSSAIPVVNLELDTGEPE
jgi:hypothetical protein